MPKQSKKSLFPIFLTIAGGTSSTFGLATSNAIFFVAGLVLALIASIMDGTQVVWLCLYVTAVIVLSLMAQNQLAAALQLVIAGTLVVAAVVVLGSPIAIAAGVCLGLADRRRK